MTRRMIYTAAMALLLSACSDEAAVTQLTSPVAQTSAPAMLGGVDLAQPVRALGTEPFWGVDFTGREMILTGVDRTELRVTQPRAQVRGASVAYVGESDDGRLLKVTLAATECSDGMSDRVYPLSAIVEVDGQTLSGCATSAAALARTSGG